MIDESVLLSEGVAASTEEPEFLFVIRNAKQSVANFALPSWTMPLNPEGGEEWLQTTARIAAVLDMLRSPWT